MLDRPRLRTQTKHVRVIDWVMITFLSIAWVALFRRIFESYAFTDTYDNFYLYKRGMFPSMIGYGRSIASYIYYVVNLWPERLDDLWMPRLFGATGVLATAIAIYFQARKLYTPAAAGGAALFFVVSPTGSAIGAWNDLLVVGWMLAVAISGGHLMLAAIVDARQSRGRRLALGVMGFTLGMITLWSYQPCFTAFCVPGIVHLFSTRRWGPTARFFAVHLAFYPVYLVSLRVVTSMMHMTPDRRSALSLDPIARLGWFVRYPLRTVMEDCFLFYSTAARDVVVFVATALTLAGIVTLARRFRGWQAWCAGGVLGACFVIAHAPNLAVQDSFVSYRSLGGLFVFKWLVIAALVDQAFRRRPLATSYALGVIAFWSFANARFNVEKGLIAPQTRELQTVRIAMNRLKREMRLSQRLNVIMPADDFLIRRRELNRSGGDEYGVLSTMRAWVPRPMVKRILIDEGDVWLANKIDVVAIPANDWELRAVLKGPVLDVEASYAEAANNDF